jgi:DNA excision repair protein ERCC-2
MKVCLSSRRNMCIHPKIVDQGDRETVDSLCRNMTASWVRTKSVENETELCNFYENYEKDGTNAG